tara:strand:- start:624 stop:1178 length:555 start_codon:yes stop_codon:yes gene_type:complete
MSRTTTVIESLPLNWDVIDAGFDAEEDQLFSATFIRMFGDWISHHYGPLNLSLCGNEVIGPIDHSALPDSLYGTFMEWIASGHDLGTLLDCYDGIAAEGDLDGLFGTPTLKDHHMTEDLPKITEAKYTEEFAVSLASMPEAVREGITSDDKLKAIAWGFFRLGFTQGMSHGFKTTIDAIKAANI